MYDNASLRFLGSRTGSNARREPHSSSTWVSLLFDHLTMLFLTLN